MTSLDYESWPTDVNECRPESKDATKGVGVRLEGEGVGRERGKKNTPALVTEVFAVVVVLENSSVLP